LLWVFVGQPSAKAVLVININPKNVQTMQRTQTPQPLSPSSIHPHSSQESSKTTKCK